MAHNGRFEFQGDHRISPTPPLPTNPTTYSQLLFGADDQDHDSLALDLGHSFNHHNDNLPKMLCFGGGGDDHTDDLLFGNAGSASTPPQRSVLTCTDSCSSLSSVSNKTGGSQSHHKSTNKKRGGNLEVGTIGTAKGTTTVAAGSQGGNKKNKGAAKGPVKARKERLGERIAALQQLVSPFGKTDTASVLHEAMGYIRFLQEQVQEAGGNGAQGGEKRDLRSRGLCLVPLACTLHVASTNGADFWSPAMANNARI